MNGATAKASRRELRRAFGPVAVASLSEGSAKIQHIDGGLKALAEQADLHNDVLQQHAELVNRGFLGRLRWLVLGS